MKKHLRFVLLSVLLSMIAFSIPKIVETQSGEGSLKVTSFPDRAPVFVDGIDTGKVTPMATSVSVGTHIITVIPPVTGWNNDTRTVTIVQGNNDLSVTLLPTLTVGPQGFPGLQGFPGPQGISGPQGMQGEPGIAGPVSLPLVFFTKPTPVNVTNVTQQIDPITGIVNPASVIARLTLPAGQRYFIMAKAVSTVHVTNTLVSWQCFIASEVPTVQIIDAWSTVIQIVPNLDNAQNINLQGPTAIPPAELGTVDVVFSCAPTLSGPNNQILPNALVFFQQQMSAFPISGAVQQ